MIRTLLLIAAVSFVIAVGCLAGAFEIVGGPFSIDDGWRFHHIHVNYWGDDRDDPARPRPETTPTTPTTPSTPSTPSAPS